MEKLNLKEFHEEGSGDSSSKMIKEELLDDDYFEMHTPKIEPIFEQRESTSTCSPSPKRRNYEPKLNWRRVTESATSKNNYSEANTLKEKQVQCRLCQQLDDSRQMKTSLSEMDKLLLMLAYLLNKKCSLEEAKSFISNVTKHHSICVMHFYESFDTIYTALDGRVANGFFECCSEALERFMITVNSLCHWMTPSKLCNVLYQFKMKNKWTTRTLPISTVYEEQRTSAIASTGNFVEYCSFCRQFKKQEELKFVSLKTEKLVFTIASIIRNECTSMQGAYFIYEKSEKPVCRVHFTEVVLNIFAVPLEKVMRIVSSLGSKITQQELKTVLKYFISMNDESSKENVHVSVNSEEDTMKVETDDQIIDEPKYSATEDFVKLSENPSTCSDTTVDDVPVQSGSVSFDPPCKSLFQQKCPALRCVICSQIEDSLNLTALSQDQKLILMIKSVLCNENTVEQAKQFLYDENDKLICTRHLSETVGAIYKSLHVYNFEEIVSSSLDTLIRILKSFSLLLTVEEFLKVFKEFVSVNTTIHASSDLINGVDTPASRVSASQYSKRSKKTQCAICFQWQFRKFHVLHLGERKFVVMVACILSGRCTPEQAKMFVSNNEYRIVCISHFSEVFEEIQKCLGSSEMKDIMNCGDKPKRRIMSAVNSIAPSLQFTSFCEMFLNFFNRNKELIRKPFSVESFNSMKNHESTSSLSNAVEEEKANGTIQSTTSLARTTTPYIGPHSIASTSEISAQKFYRPCKVCSRWNNETNMRLSLIRIEKVVIMLGSVLTNKWTLESAIDFVKCEKKNLPICTSHFSESMNVIFLALGVESLNDVEACSPESMEVLLQVARCFCASLTPPAFCRILKCFHEINKTIL